MGRPDGRIEAGQSLRKAISARAWNRAQDAADLILGSETTGVKTSQCFQVLPYNWIYVKMVVDVNVGDAIGLLSFASDTSYTGYTLSDSDLLRPIPVMIGTAVKAGQGFSYSENQSSVGIAVEPIKTNSVGRVAVSGVLACNVYCNKSWHSYAKPKDGESVLESSPYGNIQILAWHPRGTDVASSFINTEDINRTCTALVRFGTTTPCQLIVVNTVGNWSLDSTKNLILDTSVFPSGTGTNQIQVPKNFPVPGYIVARNVLCDIKQPGRGICAPYGNEWVLVNWTPAQYNVTVSGKVYNFSVPTYASQ
jgi:hypothetical protein